MPNYVNPSGLINEIIPGAWNVHNHSPGMGGEIAWNDIMGIRDYNGLIKQRNQNLIDSYGLTGANGDLTFEELEQYVSDESDPDNQLKLSLKRKMVPYVFPLDPYGYPSQGYNQHDHSNEFMGGTIVGAGNHDHRGAGYGGLSFACYHPGSHIPLRSLRIET